MHRSPSLYHTYVRRAWEVHKWSCFSNFGDHNHIIQQKESTGHGQEEQLKWDKLCQCVFYQISTASTLFRITWALLLIKLARRTFLGILCAILQIQSRKEDTTISAISYVSTRIAQPGTHFYFSGESFIVFQQYQWAFSGYCATSARHYENCKLMFENTDPSSLQLTKTRPGYIESQTRTGVKDRMHVTKQMLFHVTPTY